MSFAIYTDWQNYMDKGWENIGRRIIERNCKHNGGMEYSGFCEKCGFYEDSCEPMMNYAYPLETTPKDEDILKVCKETNCTVMYNTETDSYSLALCGGGMDLSQDIAAAYFILEKWIPFDLALQVSTQDGLSMGGKSFRQVMRACKASLEKDVGRGKARIKRIKEVLRESLKKQKEKQNCPQSPK